MKREEKQAIIESLNQRFAAAQVAYCADYRGLTVSQITNLRRQLRKAGVQSVVVKNTLARISAKKMLKDASGADVEKFLGLMAGPNFIVFGKEDPVGPAKVITQFGKENDKFQVKGGWFEGAFVDKQGVGTLATMPSREETLAKLLALISAPATQLARVIQAPGAQLARLLEAYRQKLEK